MTAASLSRPAKLEICYDTSMQTDSRATPQANTPTQNNTDTTSQAPPSAGQPSKRVAIIGGGYTGLTTAYRLAQAGYTVTVLERSATFGGLAGGFMIEGAHLEKAYHHIFKTDTDIIGLAKELGVDGALGWHDSSVSIYYGGKLWPFKGALDLLRFKPLSFINRIRAGLVVLYLQKQKNWRQFNQVTALEWMRKHAGQQVSDVIWEPLLRGKFDTYYDKVSMAWLWARIHVRANSREGGDASEKLGYFDGGFDVFTEALLAKLRDMGVTLQNQATVEQLAETADGPSLRINGQDERFDSVVATVPSQVFPRLLSQDAAAKPEVQAYVKQLLDIPYLGAALNIFTSTQEITPYYWHNINDVSKPFLVLINHTRLIDKSAYDGKYVYYIGAYLAQDHHLMTCPESELIEVWHKGLKEIFPDFDAKAIHEQHVFRFGNAQHIVTTGYTPPAYQTPLRHVYLANFSQIFPEDRGTNYAVREGGKIAGMIIASDKS